MKNIILFMILALTALSGTGCSKEDYTHLLTEPQYDQAKFRAEIGNLFYETHEKIGITTSFGFFIYSINEDKIITAFNLDATAAFGEDFFVEALLSKDGESIILSGYSHEKTIDDYHYRYDVEAGTLNKVEQTLKPNDTYPLPDQNRTAFKTSSWKAEDLAYYPKDASTPLYPFKNIN